MRFRRKQKHAIRIRWMIYSKVKRRDRIGMELSTKHKMLSKWRVSDEIKLRGLDN